MRDISRFFYDLVACIIKMLPPGGVKSIAAENLILRQQLIVIKRTRKRAPRLTQADRTLFAILAQVIPQNRLNKLTIIVKPTTILKFHRALVNRKYRLLYSAKRPRKPGPKGPEPELIKLVVEMKHRNSRMGFATHAGDVDGIAACRLFNQIQAGHSPPRRISTDHDPVFNHHRWHANLRVLGIVEVKTVPYVPLSHPFVERAIGSVRREYLDQILFWKRTDYSESWTNTRNFTTKPVATCP